MIQQEQLLKQQNSKINEITLQKSLIYLLELCNKIISYSDYELSVNELIRFYPVFINSIDYSNLQNDGIKNLLMDLPKMTLRKMINFEPLPSLIAVIVIIIFPVGLYILYRHYRLLSIVEKDATIIGERINVILNRYNSI